MVNISSTHHTPQNSIISQNAESPSPPQEAQPEEYSFLDKVAIGARAAGLSMIAGLGSYGALRPLAFNVGVHGGCWQAMDAATLMNCASVPLRLSSVAFPKTGLIRAGI